MHQWSDYINVSNHKHIENIHTNIKKTICRTYYKV